MKVRRIVGDSFEVMQGFLSQPRQSLRFLRKLPMTLRGFLYSREWKIARTRQESSLPSSNEALQSPNPLKTYFDSHKEGRGIWKWRHYFDIYHRHFAKFVGREVHVLEIGIYSGGSLEMWKQYFGPNCHVYGVDIEEACKVYEDDRTRIFIGDQADREFWKRFKTQAPIIDIVIDDGGHLPEQQTVTLEEMLPHLRSGGVYLCEDVHGVFNEFAAYVHGLADNLNATNWNHGAVDKDPPYFVTPTQFQKAIASIHLYPFATVIEKGQTHPDELTTVKHGTEWQPFL